MCGLSVCECECLCHCDAPAVKSGEHRKSSRHRLGLAIFRFLCIAEKRESNQ